LATLFRGALESKEKPVEIPEPQAEKGVSAESILYPAKESGTFGSLKGWV